MSSAKPTALLAQFNREKVGTIFSIKGNCSLSEYCSLFSNRMTDCQLVEPIKKGEPKKEEYEEKGK
jgi:hypothetical protein